MLQLDPAEGEDEFTFWLDTFAKGEPEQVHELVIACTLTQNTLNQSLDLMHQWVTRGQVISSGRMYPGARVHSWNGDRVAS